MASVAEEWDMLGGLEGIESLRRKMTKKRELSRDKPPRAVNDGVQNGRGREKPKKAAVRNLLKRLDEIGM
jgi:hypothetical protein